MTIGNVLAVVAAVAAFFVSAWAMIMTCGLLFPGKADAAKAALIARPRQCIGLGVLLVLLPGVLSVVLVAQPFPGVRLVGMLGLLVLMACAAVGASGVSFVAADRLQDMAPGLFAYAVFVRASAFVVAGSIFPILGWFAFAPLAFFAALGCGWKAVIGKAVVGLRHAENRG